MSDPKVEGPNSEPASSVNVDALLAEVKQMADRVENLIGTKKPAGTTGTSQAAKSGKPTEKKEDNLQSKPITPANDLAEQSEEKETSILTEPSAGNPDETGSATTSAIETGATEGDTEIALDQHADQIAEDEIKNVLDRIEKKEKADEAEQAQKEHEALVLQSMPKPVKALLVVLLSIDRLFLWVPRSVKNTLGLIGISTLLLTLLLWIIILVCGS